MSEPLTLFVQSFPAEARWLWRFWRLKSVDFHQDVKAKEFVTFGGLTKGRSDYPTLETITYPMPFGTFELMSIFRTFHGWDMWSLTGWYVLFRKAPEKHQTPTETSWWTICKKSLRRNNESSPKPSTSSIPKIIKIHKVCPLSWISRGGMTYISTYFGGEITPGKAIYKATYRGYIKL